MKMMDMDEKHVPQPAEPEELSRKMSQWQQANPHATLTDIEEVVQKELAQVRKWLTEKMLAERKSTTRGVPKCPSCGQEMVKNGWRRRKLKSKEGQSSELNRQH
jgi:hypothetical protein